MKQSNEAQTAALQLKAALGLGGGLVLLLGAVIHLTSDHTLQPSGTADMVWTLVGIAFGLVGITSMIMGVIAAFQLAATVREVSAEEEVELQAKPPLQEELPSLQIPEGLATDLQLPWLQDIDRQLQGMKSPEANQKRAEVERRIELVRLAALQRDLEAVTELQDEGLAAQARAYEELRSAKKDPEPEPPAAG
jgi:hypothetical protein